MSTSPAVIPGRTTGRSQFSDETVDKALALLAFNGGNLALTARELTSHGDEVGDEEFCLVTPERLRDWRTRYVERYRFHMTECSAQIEKRLVEDQRELAVIAANGARKAVQLEVDRLDSGQVKDAAASAQRLATVMGISTSKVLELTGRPTSIIEHRRPEDVVNRLSAIIDATAVEIPEGEADAPGP